MSEYRFTRVPSSGAHERGPGCVVALPGIASGINAADKVSCEPPVVKVLCIGDDPNGLARVEECLRHMARYEPQIVIAGSLAAASFALASDEFDVAIIDHTALGEAGADFIAGHRSAAENGCVFLLSTDILEHEAEKVAGAAGAQLCVSRRDMCAPQLEAAVHAGLTEQPASVMPASLIKVSGATRLAGTGLRLAAVGPGSRSNAPVDGRGLHGGAQPRFRPVLVTS